MKKSSKRYNILLESIQELGDSTPQDAITLLKKNSSTKFIETAEAHVHLNINTKYSDQQLRSTIVLPHGTGKAIKIGVFLPEEKISDEIKSLADTIGNEELIEKINKGIIDFDVLLTIPSMMSQIARLGRILGPRGLMPTPKAGTVVELESIVDTINEFKKGKIEYRADKTGIVHSRFGKLDFSESNLLENLYALYDSIQQNKPKGVKGKYVKAFHICSTMSPSIKLDLTKFEK